MKSKMKPLNSSFHKFRTDLEFRTKVTCFNIKLSSPISLSELQLFACRICCCCCNFYCETSIDAILAKGMAAFFRRNWIPHNLLTNYADAIFCDRFRYENTSRVSHPIISLLFLLLLLLLLLGLLLCL